MSETLCISVTFLDPRYHGRGNGGSSEWPPSPMRLFQAMVAGNGSTLATGRAIEAALRWLETQPPPTVLAPPGRIGTPYPLYVPNNAMDVVAKSWIRGNTDASIAEHRTLKTARPTHLRGGDTIHYLWPIASNDADPPPVELLSRAVERIVALGWGIDLVVAQCQVLTTGDSTGEGLERWDVARSHATTTLRCPVPGSLDALMERHVAFLNRLADDTFHPVPPLTTYRAVGYRRPSNPAGRPVACFELRHDDGSFCQYSQRKLVHVAGMTRHLAIEVMRGFHPKGNSEEPADWVGAYVAGHARGNGEEHRQLSYLPLPSIGHRYADQTVRRVLIAAPIGDDAVLDQLAARLDARRLKPESNGKTEFAGEPPTLSRLTRRQINEGHMFQCYTAPSNAWASVTPVILPGHDDHKPEKTRRLIIKALAQSGMDLPCDFDWSSYSRFRNSLSAHKYNHNKRPTGYIRPGHLQSQTAVHLTLTFRDGHKIPGPLAIGAGRHCGFGLMAHPPDSSLASDKG